MKLLTNPIRARLIANAVVHYNGLLLSEILKSLNNQQDRSSTQALERISPLAWQHINFYGRYRFDSDLRPLNLTAIADQFRASNAHLWRKSA